MRRAHGFREKAPRRVFATPSSHEADEGSPRDGYDPSMNPFEISPVRVDGRTLPRGYEDAIVVPAGARLLVLGGHVAFSHDRVLRHPGDLVGQFRVTLENLKATLAACGADATRLVSLTVMTTDVPAYRAHLKELGKIWIDVFGKTWPAMTLLGVVALMEEGAVVEIDGIAALP